MCIRDSHHPGLFRNAVLDDAPRGARREQGHAQHPAGVAGFSLDRGGDLLLRLQRGLRPQDRNHVDNEARGRWLMSQVPPGTPQPTPPDWAGHTPSSLVPVEPQPMTDWFHPAQLAATAIQVVISTVFGRQADHRVLEALASAPTGPFDYSAGETFTFDYVADTGDGWDSTYTVAYHLAQPRLELPQGSGSLSLPRGQVLIFGGDEVYPCLL